MQYDDFWWIESSAVKIVSSLIPPSWPCYNQADPESVGGRSSQLAVTHVADYLHFTLMLLCRFLTTHRHNTVIFLAIVPNTTSLSQVGGNIACFFVFCRLLPELGRNTVWRKLTDSDQVPRTPRGLPVSSRGEHQRFKTPFELKVQIVYKGNKSLPPTVAW